MPDYAEKLETLKQQNTSPPPAKELVPVVPSPTNPTGRDYSMVPVYGGAPAEVNASNLDRAKAVVASPLGMAAKGANALVEGKYGVLGAADRIINLVKGDWSNQQTGAIAGQIQKVVPNAEEWLKGKMPTWFESVDRASGDTNLFAPNHSWYESLGNAVAVHTSRSAAMMNPIGRVVVGVGFLESEKEEMSNMIQTMSKENGAEVDPLAEKFAVEIAGTIAGAIEYSESMIMTQMMKGTVLKWMFKEGQLQKMVFGKLGPRVGAFFGSQAIRTVIEGFEEFGQEETKLIGLLAYTYSQNLKREEEGLEPLPYVTMEEALEQGVTAFQEGISGGIAGGGIGGVVAVQHERKLQKKKAKRKLSQEINRQVYQDHAAVRGEIEELGPKVQGQVNKERKEALEKADEGSLWARVRELQASFNKPAQAMPKVEDYEGNSAKDQLINFIMDNSPMNDKWIARYEQLVFEGVEQTENLGAADKLMMKFQLINPNNTIQDTFALRKILDHIADNVINEDGTYTFQGGLNEVAEKYTTELTREMDTIKFLQSQRDNFEEGSLESLFLEGFITREVYKNMPVSSAMNIFDVNEEGTSTLDAYQTAIKAQTKKFQQAIRDRLAAADTTITSTDVRGLLLLMKAQQDTDLEQIDSLLKGNRLVQEVEDLGGEVNPARDAATPAVSQFLENYTEVLNNLIYHTMGTKKASHRHSRDISMDFIQRSLGIEFLDMLNATLGHAPFIKPADTPKGLTLQIIEELATQLEGETDPIRVEEIKRSLKVYMDRAKKQEGSGYTFAQEDKQLLGGNMERVMDMLGETLYGGDIAEISAKELFQNSVDTIEKARRSGHQADAKLYVGKFDGKDALGHDVHNPGLVQVDEGMGMTPDQVLTLFLPAFVSGKSIEDGGGFGFAKIAFLKGSKNFKLHTITKVKDGRYKATRLAGTGEGWAEFSQKPPVIKMPMAEGEIIKLSSDLEITWSYVNADELDLVTTGTAFSTEVPDPIKGLGWWRQGAEYITDFPVRQYLGMPGKGPQFMGEAGDFRHPAEGLGISPETSDRHTLNRGDAPKPALVKSFKTPYATIEILDRQIEYNGELERRTGRWFEIPVLNRGILQFVHSGRFEDQITLPAGLVINIKPKVAADDQHYPFEFNREGVRPETKKVLDEYIGDLGRGAREEQLDLYDKVKKNAPQFPNGKYFLDGSQQIPESLRAVYMHDPVIIKLQETLGDIQTKVLTALDRTVPQSQLYGRATYNGFMVNTFALGVHFGKQDQSTPSEIYLDPQLIMKHAASFMEDYEMFKDIEKEEGTTREGATTYVEPNAIWGNLTVEQDGISEQEQLGPNQQVVNHFYELALGVALHEAFHQRINEEGEKLAREFTFLVGSLVKSMSETLDNLVPSEEESFLLISKLTEYNDEFSKHKDKGFSKDFITSQGGHDTYAFKSDGSSGSQTGLRQLGHPRPAEGSGGTANGIGIGFAVQKFLEQKGMKEREWKRIVEQAELLYSQGDTAGLYDLIPNPSIALRARFDTAEFMQEGKGVLSEKGVPLTFFHGTRSDLKVADINTEKIQFGKYGKGLGLTQDRKDAETHSRRGFEEDGTSNILEVQIDRDADILVMSNQQEFEDKVARTLKFNKEFREAHPELSAPVQLKSMPVTREGVINNMVKDYDALWIKGYQGGTKIPRGEEFVVYNPGIITEKQTSEEQMTFLQTGRTISKGTQAIKGSIEFLQNGRAEIQFFRTADLSTMAHEFMHLLTPHMSADQQSGAQLAYIQSQYKNMDNKSRQDFLNKLEIVWELFKEDPTDPILQKHEAEFLLRGYMEFVARQFEKYLFQGLAPTRSLTAAFKSVKDNMRDIYATISDIPDIRADLDPVIKNVFDRMVAGSRAVTSPVAKQVLIEGGVYTVYVSRSSDKIVKTLLKKLREGYSEVQGMHDDIVKYAESVMGKKFLKDSEFRRRLDKTGTYAEGKALIDYIDRQVFKKQKKYHRAIVDEIKQIVGAIEFDKIDKSFAKLIKDEIAGIDFKKMTPKKISSLHSMREWLTTNLRKGIISTDMMNISISELKQLERLSQKNIYDFTVQELQMLRDALGTIIKEGEQKQFLRLKKKILILNRESEKLTEFGKTLTPKSKYSGLEPNPNARTEDDKAKSVLGGIAEAIRIGGRQPHRLLLYIADFDKTNPLYNFVNVIREGTRIVAARHVEDMDFMRDLIGQLQGAEHWSKKRIPETETIDERYLSHYKLKNNLGHEVELHLTKAERLSIYMYSLNEDALRHMLEGGIVMPQNKGTGINYKLTPESLAEILSEITLEEKYAAFRMMQYYEDTIAPLINKVSSNLLGYGLAKEANYFPIFAEGKARGNTEILNKPQLSKTMDQFQRKLIDRMDFLKSRTKSPSPLYIHDAFWAMEMNLQDVNRYVGLAEPLNFVKALWRDTDNKETGIYYSVARSWGPDVVSTIDKWIDRIEDPSIQEGPEGKWVRARRRTAIAAQLGANVFVSSYQRVSLMLATNYDVSRKSMGKAFLLNSAPVTGFGIGANHSMKEMAELVPELAARFETGPNVDVHELYMDSLTRHAWTEPRTGMDDVRRIHNWETFKTAINTLSVTSAMKFIKDNDAWALSTIWDGVTIEAEVQGKGKEWIREKFLEIYYNTQPNYDTENLSLMMSDKRALAKIAFGTYQTMPNQIFNEVEYHVRAWGVKNRDEKDKRTRAMNTLRMVDKVLTTLVAQQLAINMIRQLRYLGDEEEPYWKGVFLGTLRSIVAVVPYVGGLTADLVSAFADPNGRYDAFDTPGSFIMQLYRGAGISAVEMMEAIKTGDLEVAAYKGLRLVTKLLGISRGYSWDTIINQGETVVEKLVD